MVFVNYKQTNLVKRTNRVCDFCTKKDILLAKKGHRGMWFHSDQEFQNTNRKL